jgi:hypothetical protein
MCSKQRLQIGCSSTMQHRRKAQQPRLHESWHSMRHSSRCWLPWGLRWLLDHLSLLLLLVLLLHLHQPLLLLL